MTVRPDHLPFALPDVGAAELEEVREVLESGWLTSGPKAQRFEREFAAYVGAQYAVSVNSCTAAMHLSLEAAGVQAGDFVLTTPYTFAATAEVVRYFDAVPVFVDVDPETLNIDPQRLEDTLQDLERCLTSAAQPSMPAVARVLASGANAGHTRQSLRRPRAVMPVHIAGHPCAMDDIVAIAQEHDLRIVEDAAHACSASASGKLIGSSPGPGVWSTTCFSFYATKTLATGEGGMVTTDDQACAERIRLMSLHGVSKQAWKRYTADGSWYYEITAPGYKYNMPDVTAAIGLAQLRKVEAMRLRREEIAAQYSRAFEPYAAVQVPATHDRIRHAWHLYMLRLHEDRLSIGRDEFIETLKQRKIGVSVHFIPLHLHPYYRDTYGYHPDDFPVSLREYQREISLPVYSKMSDFDVQSVIDAVTAILDQCSERVGQASYGR